jgi:hypothetical protein
MFQSWRQQGKRWQLQLCQRLLRLLPLAGSNIVLTRRL